MKRKPGTTKAKATVVSVKIPSTTTPSSSIAIEQTSFQCTDCNFQLDTAEELISHRDLVHHGGRKRKLTNGLICELCGKSFETSTILRRHMKFHAEDKPFKCTQCDRQYITQSLLNEHIRIHTGYKPFQCNICQKSFRKTMNLKIHTQTHTGEKPYPCLVCGKRFSQPVVVNRHMRTHTNERPYACSECPKKFTQTSHLKTHMRIHSKVVSVEAPVAIQAPPQLPHPPTSSITTMLPPINQITNIQPAISHQITIDDQIIKPPVDNNLGDIILKTNVNINLGDKPYPCPTCGKTFSQPVLVKRHMRTHTKERPYACTLCPKAFTQSAHLKTHSRIHTKMETSLAQTYDGNPNKPTNSILENEQLTENKESIECGYQCTICWKKFKRAYFFNVHMKKHAEFKPDVILEKKIPILKPEKSFISDVTYKCSDCNEEYSSIHGLAIHIRRHGGKRHDMNSIEHKPIAKTRKKRTISSSSSETASNKSSSCWPVAETSPWSPSPPRELFPVQPPLPTTTSMVPKEEKYENNHRYNDDWQTIVEEVTTDNSYCKTEHCTPNDIWQINSNNENCDGLSNNQYNTLLMNEPRNISSSLVESSLLLASTISPLSQLPPSPLSPDQLLPSPEYHIVDDDESKVNKQTIQPKLLLLCCICKLVSFEYEVHKAHMKYHSCLPAKFKCHVCGIAFKTKWTLIAHRDIHLDIPKYCCYVCKEMYKDLKQLKIHMKVHTPNDPDECDCCECRIIVKQRRPFECKICRKRYSRKSHLIRHEKTHYTDLLNPKIGRKRANPIKRTYVCKICSFPFTKSCNLSRHMRMHLRRLEHSDIL